jgi:hypothetical protein
MNMKRRSELGVAIAFGRVIWWRNRWGFVVSAAIMLVLAVLYPFLFATTREAPIVLLSVVPLLGVFGFVCRAVLLVEEEGNLTSVYPRSMLVLPVKTSTLVLWPMIFAALAGALLWFAAAGLLYRPSGFAPPLLLPALGMAATMAWMSALSWLPIANPWVRTTVAIGLTAAMAALPLWLYQNQALPVELIGLLLTGYIVAAYGLGVWGMAGTRCGGVWRIGPEAAWALLRAGRSPALLASRALRSPLEAQCWYEWRCHGLVIPVLVLIVQAILAPASRGERAPNNDFVLSLGLAAFLGMPLILASCAQVAVGRFTPAWVKRPEFMTFVATRPMRSGDLVSAKLRTVARSVLLTWLIVLPFVGFWIFASGNVATFRRLLGNYTAQHGVAQTIAGLALALVFLPASTWKLATDGLATSLSGRRWIEGTHAFLTSGMMLALCAGVLRLILHPEEQRWFFAILPWLIVVAVGIKLAAAIASFTAAFRLRLIGWSGFWKSIAGWAAFTGCGIALAQLGSSAAVIPIARPILFLGVALMAPLGRYPLATLAVDWNRHR